MKTPQVVGTVLAVIVLWASLLFLFLCIGAYVVTINLQSMGLTTAEFWPVFWILLVGMVLFGSSSRSSKRG
jgi:hypothetical protein